jgi:hypothetical protein
MNEIIGHFCFSVCVLSLSKCRKEDISLGEEVLQKVMIKTCTRVKENYMKTAKERNTSIRIVSDNKEIFKQIYSFQLQDNPNILQLFLSAHYS